MRAEQPYPEPGWLATSQATAMGGRLYPAGLSDCDAWSSERLTYYPEEVVRIMAAPYPHNALATAPDELARIVRASGWAVKVWIREDLEDEARRLWEEQQAR